MRLLLVVAVLLSLSPACAADRNIAVAAKVTVTPETEPGAVLALLDGRLETQLTFAVKTSGEGTITFTFDHPRLVSGVRLYQDNDVYYATAYALEADADGDGTFERVLAETKAAAQKQWAEHRFDPVKLAALRFRSTAGVSKGLRAHPCLAELQIIGQAEAGDMKRASELGLAVAAVDAVRPLARETSLLVAGRAPAVLAPEDKAYDAARQALLQALAPYHPEVVATVDAAAPAQRTVICLGNMLNNPLIERLYWSRYTFVDSLVPGRGNYLLHTVYDPYPWNGGQNVLIIGCSDPTGALPAVQAFAGLIHDGKVPYAVQGGPKPLVSPEAAAKIAGQKVNPTFEEFLKHSTDYLKTGCEAYARKAVEALQTVAGLYADDGQRRSPKTDRHTVLPWNEETQSFAINCAWDAFEENPLIGEDLRLAATNAFLQFTRDLVRNVSGWGTLGVEGVAPEYNHTTFPLLGVYGGARYFQRYYQLSDMPDKLQRAHTAFRAQARSWKAPEDSDAYLPLVPDHMLSYALAENDRTYLENGNLKRYADYVVGVLDNRGLGSGFGDSGFSSTPGQALTALPPALWWTQDPGTQWLLQQYTSGGWQNPFDRGLQPERPDRFTGLNAFMLDPTLYQRIQTRPTYNEPFTRSEVAPEEAFDKVSFRESWDVNAQYLLLDGVGRGHHLHFDTNQIVEFVEGGERWLLDHDYLIRNTTEHNMLTVLRDGRGDQLVPSLAALAAHADLPGLGYTDSQVRNFNGCDWRRQILWQRGESFLVADTVTAREAGDYDFELTWKTIDSAGEQRVVGGRNLVAERGAGSARTQSCLVVDDPEASGGKALLMEQGASRIAFGAALPEGEYRLKIIGYGADSSSDSLWVSVNLGPNLAFHMPKLKYGSSTGDAANTAESPLVTLQGQGPHLLIVTLRENPAVRVDRFVLVDAAGKETTYEAEALPPAPQPSTDLSRYLHIKTTSPVRAFVTNHERAGISVPVSLYHQRQAGQLAAGQSLRFCSLMYTSLPAHRRDLQPVEAAPNLVALQGTRPALALLGPVDTGGLKAEAQAGLIAAEAIALSGMTQLQLGELHLQAAPALNVQLDLKTGSAVVESAGAAKLTVGSQSYDCPAGKQTVTVKLPPLTQARQALAALLQTKPAAGATAAQAAAADKPAWVAFGTDAEVGVVKTADLQDGGGPRLLVGRGPLVHCLDAQGKQLWQAQVGGRVKDLAVADLRPEPGLEVLVGSADTYAYIISAVGQVLDKHQMRGTPWARSFGDNAYPLYNVGAWDVNGDGQPEIVVTMKNFDLQVLDRDWKLLFKSDWALHGSMQLSFEAATGAKPDTIFVGDKYGSVVGINGDGKRVFQSYTSIGDVFYGVGDINGDGKTEVINASSTGDTAASDFATRQELWRFDNFGYPTNRVRVADVNGDGKPEVLLASGTGYLYVLDGAGKVLWRDRIGVGVNDVLVLPGGRVVYADEGGLVRVANGAGKVTKEWRTEAAPRLLAACGERVVVAMADGRMVGFGL
ncbi:hypothetical protein LLH23_17775 [bacterium]|nr:hypothetical protein [bacterium]